MRPSRRDIIIATRKSKLALAQSQAVGEVLGRLSPNVKVRFVTLESEGDRVTDRPLASAGGKGLFTRAIERTLLEGKADIAVHSLKDLPTQVTPGLVIAAVPTRLQVNDVFIARTAAGVDELPNGATVGTCSPRRGAQLLRIRSDLKIVPMRGNVDTRLRKVLEERQVDATLLAAAGLMRLGLTQHTQNPIAVEQVLPAACQAALAIQCRGDDHLSLRRCMPLNDPVSSLAVNAERDVVADLEAECHSPVAVLAEQVGHNVWRIRARVLAPDGSACLEADETGPGKSIRKLAACVAAKLLSQGAKEILLQAARSPLHV